MILKMLIYCVLICFSGTASLSPILSQPQKIVILTIPKSGTYLIEKIFKELPRLIHLSHVCDGEGRPFCLMGRKVVNIRDLRDVFSSLRSFTTRCVEHVLKTGEHGPGYKPLHVLESWMNLTHDQQLMALILLSEEIPFWEHQILQNLEEADQLVCQSRDDPNILVTRYECWIGEKGGGSFSEFSATLHRVLNHFGHQIDQSAIDTVYTSFFGNSISFDKGMIGRWKEDFKEEHIIAFKERWNGYLLNWGYEDRKDW